MNIQIELAKLALRASRRYHEAWLEHGTDRIYYVNGLSMTKQEEVLRLLQILETDIPLIEGYEDYIVELNNARQAVKEWILAKYRSEFDCHQE